MPIIATLLVLVLCGFAAIEALDFMERARFFPLGAALAGLVFASGSLVFDILERRAAGKALQPESSGAPIEDGAESLFPKNETAAPGFDSVSEPRRNTDSEEVVPAWRSAVHFGHIAAYLFLFALVGFIPATAIYIAGYLAYATTRDGWKQRLLIVLGLGALAVLLSLGLRMLANQPI